MKVPGIVLESWGVTGITANGSLQTLTGNGTISLVSGTTYWVDVIPNLDIFGVWYYNSTGATSTVFGDDFPTEFYSTDAQAGALEVDGTTETVTPEPGTLTLLVSLLGMAGAFRRKLRS
jgi:hypothetical protein